MFNLSILYVVNIIFLTYICFPWIHLGCNSVVIVIKKESFAMLHERSLVQHRKTLLFYDNHNIKYYVSHSFTNIYWQQQNKDGVLCKIKDMPFS